MARPDGRNANAATIGVIKMKDLRYFALMHEFYRRATLLEGAVS